MIFCDMGVNPTPWGYSAYEDIAQKLIAAGIPRGEIACIGEADSDAQKRSLFDRVRSGQVRVLIGSTTKMGTGTNVQKRLIALHHLDAPWKPAEVEQREGRILRQGNDNAEVAIYRYVTEGSFDSYMWQTLETKSRFISQIMSGKSGVRQAEDIGGQELSYAEVKAIASGNPAVLTLAETDAEIQRLSILRKNHADEAFLARRRLKELPDLIKRLSKRALGLQADMATLEQNPDKGIALGSRMLYGADAVERLTDRIAVLPHVYETTSIDLGSYRGLAFGITLHPSHSPEIFLQGQAVRRTPIKAGSKGLAVLNALDRLAEGYAEALDGTQKELDVSEAQYRDYQARSGAPFAHEQYLSELTELRNQLRKALSGVETKEGETAADVANRIKALRAEHTVEAAPEREVRSVTAEEPVTARIRRKAGATSAADPATRPDDPATEREAASEPAAVTRNGHFTPAGPANDDGDALPGIRLNPERLEQQRAGRGR